MDDREYELRVAELEQRKWEAEYQAKGDIEAQGFKGLVLINGGAAVALGALLQALVSKPEAGALMPYVLTGIAFNVVGVATVSVVFWVRYMQGLYEKKYKKFFRKNPWWIWRWYLGGASVLCFVIGMGIVTYGGFTHLPSVVLLKTPINIAPLPTSLPSSSNSGVKTVPASGSH